jgi:hypothetical protein
MKSWSFLEGLNFASEDVVAQTAGTATNKPKAVVTSASKYQTAEDKPALFADAMPLNALMMPTVVPNSPTNGAVVQWWQGRTGRVSVPHSQRASAFAGAAGRLDLLACQFRNPMCTKLLHRPRQPLPDGCVYSVRTHGSFFNLTFAQATGDRGCKLTRLFARLTECRKRSIMTPMDQADMMARIATTPLPGAHVAPVPEQAKSGASCSVCPLR